MFSGLNSLSLIIVADTLLYRRSCLLVLAYIGSMMLRWTLSYGTVTLNLM